MPSNEEKVLSALVHLHDVMKIVDVPKDRVMKTSQVSKSTFASLVSRMAKKGLVAYGNTKGTLVITDKGREVAPEGEFAGVTSNEEFQRQIVEKLSGKQKRIFELLMDGKVHTKQSIMDAVDCTNPKTFNPIVSRHLKKPGYIEYIGRDSIKLSQECYPMDN